jgi:hypothetical protein
MNIYFGSHTKYINRFSGKKRRVESHEGQQQVMNTVTILLEMITASGVMQNVYCCNSHYCHKNYFRNKIHSNFHTQNIQVQPRSFLSTGPQKFLSGS